MARARCLESKEDWKYSNQVDVTVTEPGDPAGGYGGHSDGDTELTVDGSGILSTFTLSVTRMTDCTLQLRLRLAMALGMRDTQAGVRELDFR